MNSTSGPPSYLHPIDENRTIETENKTTIELEIDEKIKKIAETTKKRRISSSPPPIFNDVHPSTWTPKRRESKEFKVVVLS